MSTSSCASSIDDLAGLHGAKKFVTRVLSRPSGVHAVLLYGPEGAGKGLLADFLAQSWLCTRPLDDGTACVECNVCQAFASGRAVDFQRVGPWGPMSMIKLSAMHVVPRWEKDKERPPIDFVLDFFRTRPLMARNKVVVFERADRMNADAANAFLKTLEEPPDTAKTILTTSEFTRVLPTVRSRCVCVACELPDPEGVTLATNGVSPVESVFGASPGGVMHVRKHHEIYQRLYDLLEDSRRAPWGSAFKVAEECRAIAEAYAKSADIGARNANVAVIAGVAAWLAADCPDRPDLLAAAAEAHRLVLGNSQFIIVLDDLFLRVLYHK
ncbi:MAG: AAA family ATPase [Armatimonadetes bacterium]|nr:AAA family ATPase [Armatimonadota bacterium]